MSSAASRPAATDALQLQSATAPSGAVVVRAAGRLTVDTRARLRWMLRAVAPARGGEVHLDLARVTEADAAGVAVLLVQARSCRATGGRLLLVSASAAVHDVLVKVGSADLMVAAAPLTEPSCASEAAPSRQSASTPARHSVTVGRTVDDR